MSRRSSGDGSVYRTGDGRWRYSVTLGTGPDGRQIRRYGSAPTEGEAKTLLRTLLLERQSGTLRRTQAPTVATWMTTWLDTIAPRRVKPKTLHGYRGMNRTWIQPTLGRIRLDKLQPEDVEHLHTVMRDAGKSPATCLQAHRILARALRVAQQRGHVTRNVAAIIDAPSLDRSEQDFLQTAEIMAILGATRGDPLEARWALAFLGLRQGEVLGLTWADVDLDAGHLTVNRTLGRLPRVGLVVTDPKTEASRDAVAVPAGVARLLREHRRRQLGVRVEEGPNWAMWTSANGVGPLDLVFTQRSGKPLDPRADNRAWKALCVQAGVRVVYDDDGQPVTSTVRLHQARHATGTMLRTQGQSTKVIQAVLRHASPTSTAVYDHVVPEVQRDAMDTLGATLFGS